MKFTPANTITLFPPSPSRRIEIGHKILSIQADNSHPHLTNGQKFALPHLLHDVYVEFSTQSWVKVLKYLYHLFFATKSPLSWKFTKSVRVAVSRASRVLLSLCHLTLAEITDTQNCEQLLCNLQIQIRSSFVR